MRTLPTRQLLLLSILNLFVVPLAAAQNISHALDRKVGEWTVIDRTEYGTIDLDTAHVEAMEADVYQVRTRWRFAQVQTDHHGDRYRSSVAVRAIDCRSQTMAILAYADFDDEEVIHVAQQPRYAPNWDPINPGSVVERIASWTCEQGPRVRKVVAKAGGQ